MFEAKARIAHLSRLSNEKENLRFNDLYKIVCRYEFLEWSLALIINNKGSKTAGIDGVTKKKLEDTMFKRNMLTELSTELYQQTYAPLPVRRVEIPKSNGGKRPLGIPALKDRIVQSAIKQVLEAMYEPKFLNNSHGFRPNKSCQTAINMISVRKYDWVIEGDIKGCFDNIKHGKLLDILRKRIKDEKFILLINKFLKSGYQMGYGTDGKTPVFETTTGTPQGGIVSPLLANIYLHEFDKLMDERLEDMPKKQVKSQEYRWYDNKINRLRKALREGKTKTRFSANPLDGPNSKDAVWIELNSEEEIRKAISDFKKQQKKVPYYDKEQYYDRKSFGYVRYADDFVILLGNYQKEEAVQLKEMITEWFDATLGLELSQEKTKITHSTKGFKFLGYDIVKRPSKHGVGYRDIFSQIYVPQAKKDQLIEKVESFLKRNHDNSLFNAIEGLNRIIDGWGNYYRICNNINRVAGDLDWKIFWLVAHWIGRKHRMKITEVIRKYVKYEIVKGRNVKRYVAVSGKKSRALVQIRDFDYVSPKILSDKIEKGKISSDEAWLKADYDNSAEQVLKELSNGSNPELYYKKLEETKGKCESCGKKPKDLILHHTRMVKRNQRKDSKAIIEASKELPTKLICQACHEKEHPTNRMIK